MHPTREDIEWSDLPIVDDDMRYVVTIADRFDREIGGGDLASEVPSAYDDRDQT